MPSYIHDFGDEETLPQIRERLRVKRETDERHYQKVMPVCVEFLKQKGSVKPSSLLGWAMAITNLSADECRRQLWHMLEAAQPIHSPH